MTSSPSEDPLLGQLLEELLVQYRAGGVVQLEDYCERYPEQAERLKELFAALCMMESHKPSEVDSVGIPKSVRDRNWRLGEFQILREIGRGGMGIVYEAVQLSLGRHVALKVISQHLLGKNSAVERFRREARAAARLHHTNIVPVFEVGEEKEVCFYAMQYISGQSLDQVLDELRLLRRTESTGTPQDAEPITTGSDATLAHIVEGLPLNRNVAKLGMQIADALSYANGRGILHRDIKPANILVDTTGTAWITDFGLAKSDELLNGCKESGQLTGAGDIVGTLRYLAPERLRGEHDHRGDIYGLGATLYEMLTLRPLYEAVDRVQLLDQISRVEPIRLRKCVPRLPLDLETIVHKAIAKDPAARYQSARAMADDLRLFLLDRPIKARRESWLGRTIRWCRKNPTSASLATLTLLLLSFLIAGWALNRSLMLQRNAAIELVARTRIAENESRARSILSEVTSFRLSGSAGLSPYRQRLEGIDHRQLSDKLIFDLRNEMIACLSRDDWFSDNEFVVEEPLACIDRQSKWLAETTANGIVCVNRMHNDQSPLHHAIEPLKKNLQFQLPWAPYHVCFSPNARYLVARSSSNLIEFLEIESEKRVWGTKEAVTDYDICDSKSIAAICSTKPEISLVSLRKEATREFQASIPTAGMPLFASIDPSGTRIAYCASSQPDVVQIVSIADGSKVRSIPSPDAIFARWSPDQSLLAIIGQKNQIQVWDATRGQCLSTLRGHTTHVSKLAWHPNSRYLVSNSWDDACLLWDAWSGRIVAQGKGGFQGLEFNDQATLLGWTRLANKVHRHGWFQGMAQRLPLDMAREDYKLLFATIHPNNRILAIASSSDIQFFDLHDCSGMGALPVEQPVSAAFSTEGDEFRLVTTQTSQIWPMTTTKSIETPKSEMTNSDLLCTLGPPSVVRIPPIKSGFARQEHPSAIVGLNDADNSLVEISVKSGQITKRFGSTRGQSVERFGQSDKFILRLWQSPTVEVRHLSDGQVLGYYQGGINSTSFASKDCKTIVTANRQELQFLDAQSLQPTQAMKLDQTVVGSQIAFSDDEQLMVAQLSPTWLAIIDPADYRILARLNVSLEDAFSQLLFTPDGSHLVAVSSAQNFVHVWDLRSLRQRLSTVGLDWKPADGRWNSVPPDSTRKFSLRVEFPPQATLAEKSQQRILEAQENLNSEPESAWACNNLAWVLLTAPENLRDNSRALQLATWAVEKESHEPSFRNTLALAKYRNGELDEIDAMLRRSLTDSEPNQRVFDFLVAALVARERGQDSLVELFRTLAEKSLAEYPPVSEIDRLDAETLLSEVGFQ